jgi:hypothetical protein
MIANALNIPTATVSGLIRPMVRDGILEESEEKHPCPESPHNSNVYWVGIKPIEPEQQRLI